MNFEMQWNVSILPQSFGVSKTRMDSGLCHRRGTFQVSMRSEWSFKFPGLVNRNCLTRRKLLNLLNLSFLICKVGMILITLQLFSLFFVLVKIQDVVCMTLTECLPPSSYSLKNNSARSYGFWESHSQNGQNEICRIPGVSRPGNTKIWTSVQYFLYVCVKYCIRYFTDNFPGIYSVLHVGMLSNLGRFLVRV